MKKTLSLFALYILFSIGYSQGKETYKAKTENKQEAFGTETGSLIEKSKWKYFNQVDKYKSDSLYFMDSLDIEQFKIFMKEAKELLKISSKN